MPPKAEKSPLQKNTDIIIQAQNIVGEFGPCRRDGERIDSYGIVPVAGLTIQVAFIIDSDRKDNDIDMRTKDENGSQIVTFIEQPHSDKEGSIIKIEIIPTDVGNPPIISVERQYSNSAGEMIYAPLSPTVEPGLYDQITVFLDDLYLEKKGPTCSVIRTYQGPHIEAGIGDLA
jgi:hypothetical protein